MKGPLNTGMLFGLAFIAFAGGNAPAQMLDTPWNFAAQNRAQLAVAMKQFDDGTTGTVSGAGGVGTTIVCGGGASTAAANNTCIILNNSTGGIVTDQESDGSQEATSTSSTETTSAADEVLSTLEGNR